MEDVKKAIEALSTGIEAKIAAVNEQVKTAGSANEQVKGEIAGMIAKYNELAGKLDKTSVEQQKQLDEIQKAIGRLPQGSREQKQTFADVLEKSVKFKDFKEKNSTAASIDLPFDFLKKTVQTTGNALTGEVIPADRVQGIIFDADRMVHVRQFVAQGTTLSNTIRYIREVDISSATAANLMVAESGLKPKQSFRLEAFDAPVRKIAHSLDLTDELLSDTPGLVAYISNRFGRFIPIKEDGQLLYGTGLGAELEGISIVARPFTNAIGAPLPADTQIFDILAIAILQARTQTNNGRSGYQPNAIMINPVEFDQMARLKDSEGRYLFPNALESGITRVSGVPVISSTAVTAGDFFVGDFLLGCQIFDRTGLSVAFSNENRDNFETNRTTVRMERRLAFPIYRPSAFVFDSFENVINTYSA